jgi:hypothetical protein
MLDFLVGVVSDFVRDQIIAVITWAFNAIPPLVPIVVINGALLTWLVVALVRKWRSPKDSSTRIP